MASSLIAQRIDTIGRDLARVVSNLRALGYRFDRQGEVLPGPAAGAASAVARIEREAGAVPEALKLFWLRIGSVDFSGHHPDWDGCEYPDPLIVYPPRAAIVELDEFAADREERLRSDFPYLVPIAPDALHKADVSGGMWYNVSIPAGADDPPLNDEPHETTLLAYLELALSWGGFPGLEDADGHTWPLDAIRGRG